MLFVTFLVRVFFNVNRVAMMKLHCMNPLTFKGEIVTKMYS